MQQSCADDLALRRGTEALLSFQAEAGQRFADAQAPLQLYPCHFGPDQRWLVRKVVKRDELSSWDYLNFLTGLSNTVTVRAGDVKSFITAGGRVGVYGPSVNTYVCDTGSYDTGAYDTGSFGTGGYRVGGYGQDSGDAGEDSGRSGARTGWV